MEVRKATEKLPYAVIMALLPMQLRLAWGFILQLTQSSAKILEIHCGNFQKWKCYHWLLAFMLFYNL